MNLYRVWLRLIGLPSKHLMKWQNLSKTIVYVTGIASMGRHYVGDVMASSSTVFCLISVEIQVGWYFLSEIT